MYKEKGGPGENDLLLLLLSRFSRVRVCVTPETAAQQAPLSLGFSRQEYWSGLPCHPPGESSQSRDQTQVSCIVDGFSMKPIYKYMCVRVYN